MKRGSDQQRPKRYKGDKEMGWGLKRGECSHSVLLSKSLNDRKREERQGVRSEGVSNCMLGLGF
jgi:hypothetical protein